MEEQDDSSPLSGPMIRCPKEDIVGHVVFSKVGTHWSANSLFSGCSTAAQILFLRPRLAIFWEKRTSCANTQHIKLEKKAICKACSPRLCAKRGGPPFHDPTTGTSFSIDDVGFPRMVFFLFSVVGYRSQMAGKCDVEKSQEAQILFPMYPWKRRERENGC